MRKIWFAGFALLGFVLLGGKYVSAPEQFGVIGRAVLPQLHYQLLKARFQRTCRAIKSK
jgi:hypothetical protein